MSNIKEKVSCGNCKFMSRTKKGDWICEANPSYSRDKLFRELTYREESTYDPCREHNENGDCPQYKTNIYQFLFGATIFFTFVVSVIIWVIYPMLTN